MRKYAKRQPVVTEYGCIKYGSTPFVILAPHGAGDDYNTDALAEELHKLLDASVFINTEYVKPTNQKGVKPVADFNHFRWYYDKKVYIMSGKHPAMRAFYRDAYRHIRKLHRAEIRPVVIHLHAFKHKDIAVDIGAGFTSENCAPQDLRETNKGEWFENTGVITCKPQDIYAFQRHLSSVLKSKKLASHVTIGCVYPGISRQTAVQYHYHRHPYACIFQLELSQSLRKKDTVHTTATALAQALKDTF